jgi:hypothetical protein
MTNCFFILLNFQLPIFNFSAKGGSAVADNQFSNSNFQINHNDQSTKFQTAKSFGH